MILQWVNLHHSGHCDIGDSEKVDNMAMKTFLGKYRSYWVVVCHDGPGESIEPKVIGHLLCGMVILGNVWVSFDLVFDIRHGGFGKLWFWEGKGIAYCLLDFSGLLVYLLCTMLVLPITS